MAGNNRVGSQKLILGFVEEPEGMNRRAIRNSRSKNLAIRSEFREFFQLVIVNTLVSEAVGGI